MINWEDELHSACANTSFHKYVRVLFLLVFCFVLFLISDLSFSQLVCSKRQLETAPCESEVYTEFHQCNNIHLLLRTL